MRQPIALMLQNINFSEYNNVAFAVNYGIATGLCAACVCACVSVRTRAYVYLEYVLCVVYNHRRVDNCLVFLIIYIY